MPRFYWETSPFVAWLNREQGRFETCDAILKEGEKGNVRIVTSAITLVELYGYSLKDLAEGRVTQQEVQRAEEWVAELFKAEFLEVVSVDRFIARRAHELRRDIVLLRRKPIDTIHLASASMTGVEELHTYNNQDLWGLSPFEGLRIVQPHWDVQLPLPEVEP